MLLTLLISALMALLVTCYANPRLQKRSLRFMAVSFARFALGVEGLRSSYAIANIADGIHAGAVTKLADAAITTRYLLVRQGTDSAHVALNGLTYQPSGIACDEPTAAEDQVGVQLLAATGETRLMIGNAAIATNVEVYAAASGKVSAAPTIAGIYWKVGVSRSACVADGDQFEVEACYPTKVVVMAELGNVNGAIAALTSSATTTQAEFNLLKAELEILADDLRATKAALVSAGVLITAS